MNDANTPYPDKNIPTSTTAALFTDGMIVTADDLTTAVHYPLDLMRSLNRAYFGCGAVCGLNVVKANSANNGDGNSEDSSVDDSSNSKDRNNNDKDGEKNFKVIIERGLALDCYGYPIYLPDDCELDLTPDPCDSVLIAEPNAAKTPKKVVYIAISRYLIKECPREDSDICEATSKPKVLYSRAREAVKIRVFEKHQLPSDICRLPETTPQYRGLCSCLKQCTDTKSCSGDAWVLLKCLEIGQCSLVFKPDVMRYVKPIQCLCDADYGNPQADNPSVEVIRALQSSLVELEKNAQVLKKDLQQTQATAVDKTTLTEKFQLIDATIGQLKKDSTALAKKLNDAVKVSEVEKAFEKKLKALENKLAKLEETTKKQSAASAVKPSTTKTPSPPKPGNK